MTRPPLSAPMPQGMYQERSALLDRIQFYEKSATRFGEDWRARLVDALDAHIAYAKARLERINRAIARFEDGARPGGRPSSRW
jgi:hypothetical protein